MVLLFLRPLSPVPSPWPTAQISMKISQTRWVKNIGTYCLCRGHFHSPWPGQIVNFGIGLHSTDPPRQPMKPDGPVRQPYAGVDFIPQVRDYEFRYDVTFSAGTFISVPYQLNVVSDHRLWCQIFIQRKHFSWNPGIQFKNHRVLKITC